MTVKWFLSLLKDFLFKTGTGGNPLTDKRLSFQMLSFYCQSISFGLETLAEENNWTWLTPFQKHHWKQFINQIQSGETILNPINKLVSMMFLKWGQSGPIIFFHKGRKSFVVQRKYNFEDKRKKTVWYNLIIISNLDSFVLTRI